MFYSQPDGTIQFGRDFLFHEALGKARKGRHSVGICKARGNALDRDISLAWNVIYPKE